MAEIGKSANIDFFFDNKRISPPTEWQDISIEASFDNEEIQANITIENFTFILDAYTRLKEHILGGIGNGVGIFEGLPFNIVAAGTDNSITAFNGFVDLQDDAKINDELGYIEATIKELNAINSFNDRLSALSFDFLYEKGAIVDSDFTDIDYVVEKVDNATEVLILSITLFALVQSSAQAAHEIADSEFLVLALAGGVFSAGAGGIYKALSFFLNIAYLVALQIRILNLVRNIFNLFNPPTRTHKGMSIKLMLEKVCNFLGYSFNTTIKELDSVYYLPSNLNFDELDNKGFIKKVEGIKKGIPNVNDYGFVCSDLFFLAKQLFNGKYAVLNNTIELHTELSEFWERNSSWQFPNILDTEYSYNTQELNSNIFISFSTDITDEWTIKNFTGTNYQIITDAEKVIDDKKKIIQNLFEVRIPLALGNRKDNLNGFQKALRGLAAVIDTITATLHLLSLGLINRTNYKQKLDDKIGTLKIGNNNHQIPKLLWLENGRLPQDHRTKLSAKALYTYSYFQKSFISNNYRRQRRNYESVEIPFGLNDFVQLIRNGYFPNYNNIGKGKITSFKWNISQDKAIASFYVEDVYTKNLNETYIEP